MTDQHSLTSDTDLTNRDFTMGPGNHALSGDAVASQGGPLPSDTPKTDAVAFYITNERVQREAVFADFARAQERRIAELEKDSARYRWIVSADQFHISEPIQAMWRKLGVEGRSYPTPDEWSAAIDASMEKP